MNAKKTILIGLLLLLASTLAACNAKEVKITDANEGATVELEVGQVLAVTLVSNPTTGYSWQVAEVDAGILAYQEEVEYQQEAGTEGLVGAGGTEILRFDAKQAGETTLILYYQRPWETEVEPLYTFTVQVSVR